MRRLFSTIQSQTYHPEIQYLNLIRDIIHRGNEKITRNGVTKSIIGANMRFNLEKNTLPLLTTKKMAWKSCLKELLWFINGDTDNKKLQDQHVTIWNGNASRDFLDSRGLFHYKENDLGPIYGYQWRHFNKPYKNKDKHNYYKHMEKCLGKKNKKNIDQLEYIIQQLNHPEHKYSRRLIMTAWNPVQLDQMALPPCHILSQFCVTNNKLSCLMYQRSGDVGLGIPFNIASYSFLTLLLAHHCGLEPGEFIHYIGDAHIYRDHIESLEKQIERKPLKFPTCEIIQRKKYIDDYCFSDFKIKDYKHHNTIKMKMIA